MINTQGFLLIEIVVVICLCAFIASLGIIQLSFLDSTTTRIKLDTLVTACTYLQQKAMLTNTEKILECNTQTHEYYGENIREKLLPNACFGYLPHVLGSPGSSIQRITKPITFVNSKIHFYPTGVISSGTLYIVDKKQQYMYALTNAISQFSYLRMYSYNGAWNFL